MNGMQANRWGLVREEMRMIGNYREYQQIKLHTRLWLKRRMDRHG